METRPDGFSNTSSEACHSSCRLCTVQRRCKHSLLVTRVTLLNRLRVFERSSGSWRATLYSSVSVSQPIAVALYTLYPDSPLSACSQPPHPGSSWFHAFMGDFMSNSFPERRSHPFRSSSVPSIPDATVIINPLHGIVTVGRGSSHECGSRGSLHFACSQPLFNPLGRMFPLRGWFHLVAARQAASGRLRCPLPPPHGFWSYQKRSGSSSRGHLCRPCHPRSLHH
jgi:hypothetical protein